MPTLHNFDFHFRNEAKLSLYNDVITIKRKHKNGKRNCKSEEASTISVLMVTTRATSSWRKIKKKKRIESSHFGSQMLYIVTPKGQVNTSDMQYRFVLKTYL